jgi:hypothetical protein
VFGDAYQELVGESGARFAVAASLDALAGHPEARYDGSEIRFDALGAQVTVQGLGLVRQNVLAPYEEIVGHGSFQRAMSQMSHAMKAQMAMM